MRMRIVHLLLIPVLLLFAAPSLRAQYLPDWEQGDLKKKGTRIAVRGEKLTRDTTLLLLEEFEGPELAAKWKTGRRLRDWGLGLTIGGFTAFAAGSAFGGFYVLVGVIGTIFAAFFGQDAVDSLWDEIGDKASAGIAVSSVGLAVGVTGIVIEAFGNRKMRKIVRYCNENGKPKQAELVFGPVADDRLGLALRF